MSTVEHLERDLSNSSSSNLFLFSSSTTSTSTSQPSTSSIVHEEDSNSGNGGDIAVAAAATAAALNMHHHPPHHRDRHHHHHHNTTHMFPNAHHSSSDDSQRDHHHSHPYPQQQEQTSSERAPENCLTATASTTTATATTSIIPTTTTTSIIPITTTITTNNTTTVTITTATTSALASAAQKPDNHISLNTNAAANAIPASSRNTKANESSSIVSKIVDVPIIRTHSPSNGSFSSSSSNEANANKNNIYLVNTKPNANTISNPSPSPNPNLAQFNEPILIKHQPGDIIHHHPVFVKDTSKYWYKPTISREEAINMLRDKPPGTFVVRDSNSFRDAFGLALKVATPPPGIHSGDGTELVRHFLIEPSPKGVKLKGCNNEPIFGSLSALVYQHSITPLALPTKLLLPDYDPASTPEHISTAQALLQQGAACNVTYIASLDTESLTGPEAVRRCIGDALELYDKKMVQPVSVHFKVSSQGVTITDNTRRLFFRRHYPVQSVTFAGIDPADRRWDNTCISEGLTSYVKSARMFAFVARKIGSRTDNACHVFAELEPEQPASAVVNFITKVMMGCK